jgi:hypothetical protein
MVRKMGVLPKFLVFNSETESFENSYIFAFYLLLFAFIHISVFTFLSCCYGVSDILMSVFQMELNDYPHFFLTEDGRLCSTDQHCPGFPRVLYDALLRLDPSLAASRHRRQYDGTHHPHLPMRGLPHRYSSTAYRAYLDSESGEPHMVVAP